MTSEEQAMAYASADFEAPHSRVVELFVESFSCTDLSGDVLDLGCGPGDIAMRFARRFPKCRVIGLDGSEAMLRRGWELLAKNDALRSRVKLVQGLLPGADLHGQRFSTVISNSLLHHLHEPAVLWDSVKKFAAPGARVFVVDLMRPADEAAARALTAQYCANEPPVLREDFYNSLLAAFTVDEVRHQLKAAELDGFEVRAVSDRHLVIHGLHST